MKPRELTLEEIQQGSFNVLKKIKEIFDENGWKYYLAYGTLIGAIRHQGFIPWDDDIDIWVPRPDYEKFVQYCKDNKEIIKPFELMHYSTNEKNIYPISRFSDSNFCIDYKDTKDYGLGLFVDIYPLDGIDYSDSQFRRKLIRKYKEITILGSTRFIPSNSILKNIIKYPYFYYVKTKNINQLLKKLDKFSQKYNFDENDFFDCVCWGVHDNKHYKKEMLDGGCDLECFKLFNGIEFRVPYKFDECLTEMYGDYMKLPPEKERVAHHYYSAYKKN